ncbi:hypothetical protein E4T56_gene17290, partial [Termitomyces sp. T112]
HKGATDSAASTLVPGEADRWETFDVSSGLEELRSLLHRLPSGVGVRIRGEVGLTSHVADLLRRLLRSLGRIAAFAPPKHFFLALEDPMRRQRVSFDVGHAAHHRQLHDSVLDRFLLFSYRFIFSSERRALHPSAFPSPLVISPPAYRP